MKKLVIAAAVGMLASTNVFASDIQDLSALARDVVLDSPGLEAIVPLFANIDTDSNGIPDKLRVSFKVYIGGTTTLLHNSTFRYVDYPSVPCIAPGNIEPDFEAKFLGRPGSPRTHIGMILSMGCWDLSDNQWKESASKTFIYSADVSQESGTVWTKTYYKDLLGFNGLDTDNDGKSDTLMVSLLPDNDNPSADMTVILLNPTDGTVISQNKYPVLR